jgi:hypothetical protein
MQWLLLAKEWFEDVNRAPRGIRLSPLFGGAFKYSNSQKDQGPESQSCLPLSANLFSYNLVLFHHLCLLTE